MDSVSVDIDAYVLTGPSDAEGDIVVLTNATGGTLTYIHNGGVSGTSADYTLISSPSGAITTLNLVSDLGPGQVLIDNSTITFTGTHGLRGVTSAPGTVTFGFSSDPTTGGATKQV